MKKEFYQGKVKQYNPDKGFGFIATAEGEIFFHISDFPASEGEPKRNEKVKFVALENNGKFKSTAIQRFLFWLCFLLPTIYGLAVDCRWNLVLFKT